jgi:hypothetical protein
MSFKKGFTYLVQVGTYFYIVQQTGHRTWAATVFTHVCPDQAVAEFTGNGKALYEKLEQTCFIIGQDFKPRAYVNNQNMRGDMFNVLKYGEFR